MIKVPVEYEDFDGVPQKTDCYFHLSKAELLQMEGEAEGGLAEQLKTVGKSAKGIEIIQMFTDIVGRAYGERVDGSGTQFFKSTSKREAFLGSLEFDALLTKLITNPGFAIEFVNGVIPNDIAKIAADIQNRPAETDDEPWITEKRAPTQLELQKMSQAQLAAAWQNRDNIKPA